VVWRSDWMLLARDPKVLAAPEIEGPAQESKPSPRGELLWTDTFSNLLEVFKG